MATALNYRSANLNSSYFTDRQDRYLRFRSHGELAQYCREFLHKSSTFSYQLLPSSSRSSEPYSLHWPDPHTHPHHLESKAKQALTELQSSWVEKSRSRPSPSETEVLLFPVIQAGQFGIREEEQAVGLIFNRLTKHRTDDNSTFPLVDLTSGYFGLSKLYQNLVLQSGVHTQLLCASPQVRHHISPFPPSVSLILPSHSRQMVFTMDMVYPVAYPRHIHTWSRDS